MDKNESSEKKAKRLDELLDRKNFNRLVDTFGGQRIWIPKRGNRGYRDRAYLSGRNIQIITLYRSGRPVKDLSREFDLSVKTIYEILNTEVREHSHA